MRVVESGGMQPQAEDLLGRHLRAPVHARPAGRAEIPFEQVAVRVIVEAVVLLVVSPGERCREGTRGDPAVEFNRCGDPGLLVRFEPFGVTEASAGDLRPPRPAMPADTRRP